MGPTQRRPSHPLPHQLTPGRQHEFGGTRRCALEWEEQMEIEDPPTNGQRTNGGRGGGGGGGGGGVEEFS
eukprot:scaffold314226_cov24-Tisochrysis_lutea.AAC.1